MRRRRRVIQVHVVRIVSPRSGQIFQTARYSTVVDPSDHRTTLHKRQTIQIVFINRRCITQYLVSWLWPTDRNSQLFRAPPFVIGLLYRNFFGTFLVGWLLKSKNNGTKQHVRSSMIDRCSQKKTIYFITACIAHRYTQIYSQTFEILSDQVSFSIIRHVLFRIRKKYVYF